MNTVEIEHREEQVTETFPDHLPLPDSPVRDGIHDEPDISPRVGSQYQVEIPELITEYGESQLKASLNIIDGMLAVENDFGTGLAIPIMWVLHEGNHVEFEQKDFVASTVGAGSVIYTSNEENKVNAKGDIMHECPTGDASYLGVHPQGSTCKVEIDFACSGNEFGKDGCHGLAMLENKISLDFSVMKLCKVEGYSALPGLPATSWSDAETQSFLLGLYIFGKNLVQIRKFIECKEMGDILTYYYGRFYRSDSHRRWSECRNMKSRRCILGQRIFTGWRQQELLSRVLPTVSKEVQDTLLEATKIFNEGTASLEEYVSTLKTKIGMQVLVNAVGIGQGKHDLTGIISDPARTNQALSIRPEIPNGKACSSLSSGEIVKYLTGDFRLSKARSNDLFWEAVWPRLLAKGWHSEQPKDLSSIGSKQSLVFLTPGVKKFSRKKLVKGNHYFDCVSDVLSKVASDPRLLELEIEGTKGNITSKDENGWAMDARLDQNGLPNQQRQSYLRPRVSICNSELMKFMVVDTSLIQGEVPMKIRELRKLPIDATTIYGAMTQTEETGSISSEEHQDSDDSSSDGNFAETTSKDEKLEQENLCMISQAPVSPLDYVGAVSSTRIPVNGHVSDEQCTGQFNEKLPVKDTECQLSLKAKFGRQAYLAPFAKRRRMAACKYEDTGSHTYSSPTGCQQKEEESLLNSSVLKSTDEIVLVPDHSQGTRDPIFATKDSSDEKTCYISSEYHHGNAVSTGTNICFKQPESHTSIDLNLIPRVTHGCGTSEQFTSDAVSSQFDLNAEDATNQSEKQQVDSFAVMESSAEVKGGQHPSENSRRQSTRNRPPTTRALEALACGFIGTKRKGRDVKSIVGGTIRNRPSRRVRRTVESPSPVPEANVPHANVAAASAGFGASNIVTDDW